jgi:hypothetical protein
MKSQESKVAALGEELKGAQRQVNEVAQKAIEGASLNRALSLCDGDQYGQIFAQKARSLEAVFCLQMDESRALYGCRFQGSKDGPSG